MRKALTLALLLGLSAAPLAAQQEAPPAAAASSEAAAVAEPRPAGEEPAAPRAEPAKKPSLHVDREEWRESFRQQDERQAGAQQIGSRNWWYIVAAVAVGVIIAAVIL